MGFKTIKELEAEGNQLKSKRWYLQALKDVLGLIDEIAKEELSPVLIRVEELKKRITG